jgi:hypothetical protein
MDWDPVKGTTTPTFLRNHPSAIVEAALVADASSTGFAASIMRICTRDELLCCICILTPRVIFNSADK